jgi:hypothetical protein
VAHQRVVERARGLLEAAQDGERLVRPRRVRREVPLDEVGERERVVVDQQQQRTARRRDARVARRAARPPLGWRSTVTGIGKRALGEQARGSVAGAVVDHDDLVAAGGRGLVGERRQRLAQGLRAGCRCTG